MNASTLTDTTTVPLTPVPLWNIQSIVNILEVIDITSDSPYSRQVYGMMQRVHMTTEHRRHIPPSDLQTCFRGSEKISSRYEVSRERIRTYFQAHRNILIVHIAFVDGETIVEDYNLFTCSCYAAHAFHVIAPVGVRRTEVLS